MLNFDIDATGIPFVTGQVTADLALICQRCLEPITIAVDQPIALAWIEHEQAIDRLPIRYEPYLVEQTPLTLSEVIEDELLLAVPQIPLHDTEQCNNRGKFVQTDVENVDVQNENPFAILAKLKSEEDKI